MQTYTLAIADGVLFACLPDDADVAGAVAEATAVSYGHGIALDIVRGTVLTDAKGEGDEVVFVDGLGGELADASGRCWRYAVRRAA